ncbi:unnamed protein product, partial [Ectocarpus sp. 12 AP-2014]
FPLTFPPAEPCGIRTAPLPAAAPRRSGATPAAGAPAAMPPTPDPAPAPASPSPVAAVLSKNIDMPSRGLGVSACCCCGCIIAGVPIPKVAAWSPPEAEIAAFGFKFNSSPPPAL